MTKRADDYSGYQEHPRFGRGPRITGLNPSDQPYDPNVHFHWNSGVGVRIPDTAVVANLEKQQPATFPVTHYFDSKRVCRKCGGYFIFFAEEQRYWYEELRFPLDANMVNCLSCRKVEQRLYQASLEYERLLAEQGRSEEATLRMVECGVFLVEEGVFTSKMLSKLRGFLNGLSGAPGERTNVLRRRITFIEQ